MRVFVTGGAGFLGSHVCTALLSAKHDVTVLHNLSTGHREALPEGVKFIEGDVGDEAQLPGWLAGQEWLQRLQRKDAGVPYGIALAAAALAVYPDTQWMASPA